MAAMTASHVTAPVVGLAGAPHAGLSGRKRERDAHEDGDEASRPAKKPRAPIFSMIKNKSGDWRTANEKQRVQLRKNFLALDAFLRTERIVNVRAIARARWVPDEKVAEVVVLKGKQFAVMGHYSKGRRVLLPEEAASLVERGAIEIELGGVALSLQHLYALMYDAGVPLDVYHVFALMNREGYVCCRYGHIAASAAATKARKIAREAARKLALAEAAAADAADGEAASEDVEGGDDDLVSPTDVIDTDGAVAARVRVEPRRRQPAPSLTARIAALARGAWSLAFGWLARGPRGREPLIAAGTTLANARERLSLTCSVSAADHVTDIAPLPAPTLGSYEAGLLTLNLDVYERTRGFRLSDPPAPLCRIAVCSASSAFPSLAELERLVAVSHPVPVKIAVVQGGNICFFALDDIVLPDVWQLPSSPADVAAYETRLGADDQAGEDDDDVLVPLVPDGE